MAWQSTKVGSSIFGNRRVAWGTWSSASATGGDIATGLRSTEYCDVTHTGAAVEANVAVVNETFPLASGNVTIVCSSGDTGIWYAIGY